ncbi:hypothetical protein [Mucilaginibacter antarcticus]|uniref:Uncharacterized protein n=1 Tax=Mucilaginibacter antarcticus TaxID=1855725 RepID=A0ABW5XQ78_9SPHI
MTTYKNIQPLSAEALFDLLKKEFTNEINTKLDSSVNVEYAHVYDVINVSFPEIIEGTVFTILVNDNEIELTNNSNSLEYNTELLEEQLAAFLNDKCS